MKHKLKCLVYKEESETDSSFHVWRRAHFWISLLILMRCSTVLKHFFLIFHPDPYAAVKRFNSAKKRRQTFPVCPLFFSFIFIHQISE